MKVYLVLAALCMSIRNILGQGAGRAIPIASENFVLDLFRRINPRIEYDATNFLVDLSGNYANCNFIGRRRHYELRDNTTPEGASIGVIQDYTRGTETHTNAVDAYIQPVFETWVYGDEFEREKDFTNQIQVADKFGCSVRPGCNGQVSVACLFSPSSDDFGGIYDYDDKVTEPKAKAFTEDQYRLAEQITGQTWDASHYLENLSGFETDCAMVNLRSWSFPYATSEASDRGLNVIGLYGSALNLGSTPDALEKILSDMKIVQAKMVGCSLVPDCILQNDVNMYVVVSCIFEI